MPSPNRAWLGLLLLAGCAGPASPPPSVWVDLSQIPLPAERPFPIAPSPPKALGATTIQIPGLPAREVETAVDRTLEQIRQAIEDDVSKAVRLLEARLRRIYANEVRASEREMMGPLGELSGMLVEEAFAEVSARFEAYAEARGRILPEISIRIRSTEYEAPITPPANASIPIVKRFEEAAALQKQLFALDAEWRNLVDGLLADADRKLKEKEAELRTEFARRLQDAQDRAAKEAADQVAKSRREIGIRPGTQARLSLPAERPFQIRLPGGKPIPPAPSLPPTSKVAIRDREALEADLRIWLGLNGYKLDRKGENRTQEFLRWKQEQAAGP